MDLFNQDTKFQLKLQRPLAFFDLETTGVDVGKDRIVEIAIIKALPDGLKEEFHQVVNPTIPIPKEASAVHGITDEMVQDKPTFASIAKSVIDFLEDSDLAGFNSNRFDVPLLVEELLRCGLVLDLSRRRLIDVQRIYHKLERRNLEAAYRFYCNKDLQNAHSALADVTATYEVLLAQVEKTKELENDIQALEKFVDEAPFIDVARRLSYRNGKVVFNFGKYKDVPVVEVLSREPQYYDWVMKSDFPLHTKQKLKEIRDSMRS